MNISSLPRSAGATRSRVEPLLLMRWSMAVCYLWFGALKFFPGMSPAEVLASDTIEILTRGLITGRSAVVLLACLECGIGLGLITGRGTRAVIAVLLAHMLCTFAPMILFPTIVFTRAPFALTLLGQYIIKNLVIASAAWMLLRSGGPAR